MLIIKYVETVCNRVYIFDQLQCAMKSEEIVVNGYITAVKTDYLMSITCYCLHTHIASRGRDTVTRPDLRTRRGVKWNFVGGRKIGGRRFSFGLGLLTLNKFGKVIFSIDNSVSTMVNSRTSEREQTPPPTGWLISDQGLNTPTLPISPPGRKTRANPSITPRKFRRFFTPRTQESTSATPKLDLSTSRQALHEITGQPKRKRTQPSPLRNDSIKTTKQEDSTTITPDSKRGVKRRKLDSSPAPHIKEYGLKVSGWDSPSGQWPNVPSSPCERAAEAGLEEVKIKEVRKPPKPIKQLPEYGLSARLLRMNIGSCTKSTRQYDAYPTNGMI